MTPLARIAWGFLVVVIDFRVDGVDVIADVAGWALVLFGTTALTGRSPWFTAASAAAAFGALLSLPQLLSEPGGLLQTAGAVVETALVFSVCTGIMQLVDEPQRTTADRIRWADLAVGVLGVALGLVVPAGTQVTNGAAVVILVMVIVALLVMVWFLLFLLGVQRHPALGSSQPQVA